MPQVSAEVRWFGSGAAPEDLHGWFCETGAFRYPVGGGHEREDVYLQLKDTGLSIKARGGKAGFEVKGLIGTASWKLQFGRVTVGPQLLCKWSSAELQIERKRAVDTMKVRWLRKFALCPPSALMRQIG
jgi:hypothetical protein